MTKPVVLTEALLLGRGGHKDVYADPENFTRCIKIIRNENDSDWKRELRYRRSRMRRGLTSHLLPAYYGPIETNLGRGYVFERIFNFDGSPSLNFDTVLAEAEKCYGVGGVRPKIEKGLLEFHEIMRDEEIILSNVQTENFLIQHTAPEVYRIRIVDNIGSPVAIPLMFYISCFAQFHIERYWRRFIDLLRDAYPNLITEDMKGRLL